MKFLLFFFFLFESYFSLMAILDKNKPFCVYKNVQAEDKLRISFAVSGEEKVENSVDVRVFEKPINSKSDLNNKVIYVNKNQGNEDEPYFKSDDLELSINQEAKISYCFTCKEFQNTIVSFEIFTINESGHILSIAKDGKKAKILLF